ncbi:MAG: MmcQ/YjbR family DNA-binding protein [Saprospiraceae bacterium]|nr:MmcQ/YjbR family DNA-binding protein [Saprospiraceae bacterium]
MEVEEFREMVFSFPHVVENPHFDRQAFKAQGKRIFTTLHQKSGTANLKLSPEEQATFCAFEGNVIYPVANKWGQQGWTTFEIAEVPGELMLNALESAYNASLR